MEIKGANYRVWYDPANVVVSFEGILRLSSPEEYQPIEDLLSKVLETNPSRVTHDLRGLTFINSSGINVLYKFASATRKQGELRFVVQASKSVAWQGKALPDLMKFNPNVELTLYD
jgi:anti-anti-sigma factor